MCSWPISFGTILHSLPRVEMVISKYTVNLRWTVIKLSSRRNSSVTADHVILCYATISPRTVMFYLCYFGSRDGARLPLMWPEFDSGPVPIYGLSLLLVLALFPGFFSEFYGFPLPRKTNISKFQFGQYKGLAWEQAKPIVVASQNISNIILLCHVIQCGRFRWWGPGSIQD